MPTQLSRISTPLATELGRPSDPIRCLYLDKLPIWTKPLGTFGQLNRMHIVDVPAEDENMEMERAQRQRITLDKGGA